MRLTERDVRTLKWIGEQFVVNIKELDALLCLDAEQHHLPPIGQFYVRDLIHRWKKSGLVQTTTPLRRGSHVFLTAQGIRLTGLPYAPRTPSTSDVARLTHHDGVNALRIFLERQAWQGNQVMTWVSERSLMQEQKLFAKAHPHQPTPHRPDAEILTGDECIAIEYEKAYKRPVKLQSVLQDYLFRETYTGVRYFCETPAIQQSVARTIQATLHELPLAQREELQHKVTAEVAPWNAR